MKLLAALLLMSSMTLGQTRVPDIASAPIDYRSAQVVSLVQGILDVFGYPCKDTGIIDKDTRKQLVRFQKEHNLNESGDIDEATYATLSNALNHPKTFTQIRDDHGFPKWATTVCLVDKNSKQDMPEEGNDDTASSFFILGTFANDGIQTVDYRAGRPLLSSNVKWNRQKSTMDSVNFSTFFNLGKPNARYALLNINWSLNGEFQMSFRQTVTNQPIFSSSGHCHPIYRP